MKGINNANEKQMKLKQSNSIEQNNIDQQVPLQTNEKKKKKAQKTKKKQETSFKNNLNKNVIRAIITQFVSYIIWLNNIFCIYRM
jgi:hypothetical protein